MTPSLAQAARWYVALPTTFWPTGMRVSETDLASGSMALPWRPDAAAWFTINALSPTRAGESSHHRAVFMRSVTLILSVVGVFDPIAALGGYVFNTLAFEHYPFLAINITFAQIVAWFVQHGIAPGSDSLTMLESFTRSRRNHSDRQIDLNNAVFPSAWPNSAADIANITLSAEDMWANL